MRLDVTFARLALQVDAHLVAAEIAALPESCWSSHPEGAPGNSAVPLVAIGGDEHDNGTIGAMAPTRWLQAMPYTRSVMAALGAPIGRTRLMRIEREGKLGAHVDTNRYWQDHLRVHVPVITHPAVQFTCKDDAVHMGAGEVWVFDTWQSHGVINPADHPRTHLVIDTVGSARLWALVDAGLAAGMEGPAPGQLVAPGAEPEFESAAPLPITPPWQQQLMADGVVRDLGEGAPPAVVRALRDFVADWYALWATHGAADDARTSYAARAEALHALLDELPPAQLPNGSLVAEAVRQLLLRSALSPATAASSAPTGATPARTSRPPTRRLDRPVFIVSTPRSGSSLLFETLARAKGAYTIGGESHEVFESIPELHPAQHDWASNALVAADATPGVVHRLEDSFIARATDRDGRRPQGLAPLRLLEKTPKNALRVPFLAEAFPDAQFVYLHRDPMATISSMLDAWRSRRFVTYPQLPGWGAVDWSLLLTPGWRGLMSLPLPEVVARQWATTSTTLLDDLQALPPHRWCVVGYEAFVSDPDGEAARLSALLDLEWDRPLPGPPPPSRHTLDAPAAEKWRRNEADLAPLHPIIQPVADRVAQVVAHPPSGPQPRRRTAAAAAAPAVQQSFESVHTATFPELLRKVGCSLIVTTYQSGRVVLVRPGAEGEALNTHLRAFPRPMGVAVAGRTMALGTDQSVWRFDDQPALAQRLGPEPHDGCFVPRSAHVTGDISVHEMAFAGDELWLVNTRFSCLATLDQHHSFVPRWRPAFVTALVAEDRCHLNGLAVVDGRPRFVTAMGMTDEPQGWRRGKVGGGVVLDVDSNAVVAHGLTMPHSPRWHDGRLWVLDSGHGTLCTIDLDTGSVAPIVRLPGFPRGLTFIGRYALVGLSKVREHVFAGLPLAEHIDERLCGVWIVDTVAGTTVGFLRFDGTVEEVFDVQVLAGYRNPDVLEPGDPVAASGFVLPTQG